MICNVLVAIVPGTTSKYVNMQTLLNIQLENNQPWLWQDLPCLPKDYSQFCVEFLSLFHDRAGSDL